MKGLALLLVLITAVWLQPQPARLADAAERGERQAGFALAQDVCAECHAVNKGERQSPHGQAPSFTRIANARGMNPARLRVWFQVSHRSMPDLHLTEQQSDDLIAYITSLRTK